MRLAPGPGRPVAAARRLRRARRRGAGAPAQTRPGRLRPGEGRRRREPGAPDPDAAGGDARGGAGARRGRDRRRRHHRHGRREARVAGDVRRTRCSSRVEWSRWGADGAEGSGELRMLVCQPTCASGSVEHVPARITLTGVTRCDGRRYFAAGTLAVDPALTPDGRAAGHLRPGALLRRRLRGASPSRTGAVAAQRARGARDQLAAPAAAPRVHGLHQLAREPVGVRRADHCLDELGRAPVARPAGRRVDADQRQVAELRIDGPRDPLVVAVARRRRRGARAARPPAAAPTPGRCEILCTAGSGCEETPNALPGVSDETCWPRLGVGWRRPVTLPSQVIVCNCSSSPPKAEASRPADGSRGPRLEATEASAVAASGGSAVMWIDHPARVQHRARHLQALQPLRREPLGDDGDHAAAGLDAGAQRIHQQPGLLGRRRLRNRVDPALGTDQIVRA